MTAEGFHKEAEPLQVIGAIRDSFQDAAFVYKNGSCFELYRILRTIFPEARPWTNFDHVWVEIAGKLYDIDGLRSAGTEGLSPMWGDTALMERAHGWKWRSVWRVDQAMEC
ncbi:hypothetical protein ACFFUB_00565 [Algimonas porphyrae]|uniref:Uncharacterized protein n=1 Tax=Algimonas porphyrae TaxID=1128113 RepID=A0ABQ5UZ22_9PROT|nr:hypothetical protein [Algimonas porphyrae]GLQ20523.1 hypothetical protein GCM10007854_14780 [Algimonas porphyrae]